MSITRAARLLLIGAPGSGKGTQTERLMNRYAQLSAISSGDLLRKNVREKTPLGIQVAAVMKAGAFVPDNMILRLIRNELTTRGWLMSDTIRPYSVYFTAPGVSEIVEPAHVDEIFIPSETRGESYSYSDEPDASFILDGFPRNAVQASKLDELIPINFAVHINTPASVILDRIANRWVHAPSGRVYNTTFNPPKVPGKDDITGEPLTRREDDDPDVWKARLKQFEEATLPLLEHYDKQGVLHEAKGNTSDEITPQILKEFQKRFGGPSGSSLQDV